MAAGAGGDSGESEMKRNEGWRAVFLAHLKGQRVVSAIKIKKAERGEDL